MAARTSSGSQAKLYGGEERWKIKTLSDRRVGRVNFDAPRRHSIHYLITRGDPDVGADTLRDEDGSRVEVTVYDLVGVRLVDERIEEDGDIHLVIRSKYASETMIVEFPNVACKGARVSKHKDETEQARTDFATQCGLDAWATRKNRASPKPLVGRASIVGRRVLRSQASEAAVRRRAEQHRAPSRAAVQRRELPPGVGDSRGECDGRCFRPGGIGP